MNLRPLPLAAAVAAMLAIGTGIAFVAALLLVVAAGGVAFYPTGSTSTMVVLLGVVGLLAASVTFASAAGLWLRRPWGWAGSLAIALVSVAGAVAAHQTAGSQPPLVAGLVLTLGATGLLLATPTRRAAGIG